MQAGVLRRPLIWESACDDSPTIAMAATTPTTMPMMAPMPIPLEPPPPPEDGAALLEAEAPDVWGEDGCGEAGPGEAAAGVWAGA